MSTAVAVREVEQPNQDIQPVRLVSVYRTSREAREWQDAYNQRPRLTIVPAPTWARDRISAEPACFPNNYRRRVKPKVDADGLWERHYQRRLESPYCRALRTSRLNPTRGELMQRE